MCMNSVITILLFVFLMSVIVSIHEFGHFIVAKLFNVYCGEFSIGMGPLIYQRKGKETNFSIRALPIGGFVSMAGDNENSLETTTDKSNVPFDRTLPGLKPLKRIGIMLAGPFMNFVLAIVIIAMVILVGGQYGIDANPTIASVEEGSPASEKLEVGDIIEKLAFDNNASINVSTYTELVAFTYNYPEYGDFIFTVNRDGEIKEVRITPKYNESEERYLVGITFNSIEYVDTNIFNCWYYALDYIGNILSITLTSLASLFRGIGLKNVSGPIGIYKTVEETVQYGPIYYLNLMAVISVSIGAFNLIPLPIFDGGRVVLTLCEMLIGKPIDKKYETIIMTISTGLVFALMIYVTINDILKLF